MPHEPKVLRLPAWHAARYERLAETGPGRFDRLAERIDAGTPAQRDRAVDVLRALAILGVVLGHWLVTALVPQPGGGLRVASPLQAMPALEPATWLLQTLAVFFLVGGYSTAKSLRPGEPYRDWTKRRLGRLVRPVPPLLLAVALLSGALLWSGHPADTVQRLALLALSPLWFLCVYGALALLAPALAAVCRRTGPWAAVVPFGATAVLDLGPEPLAWGTVLTCWPVPFLLGIAWAQGAFTRRRGPVLLLAGGSVATALLVLFAGYPASMVGVPGAAVSNLSPPTLAAATFGLAQTGGALLLRGPLTRWARRPGRWAVIALVTMSSMTIFLWHQPVLLATSVTAHAFGTPPGLLTAPGHPGWLWSRLLWLPVLAAVLTALAVPVRGIGRRRTQPRRRFVHLMKGAPR
ncbi:acyltransferase family protein [Actinomadura macrotermitis]|uniref:Acyltransferase 3 domain-containing protein n=1 Tax=Actinomadura macrotermitis TaxID=2585200 RepID=A0A7K0C4A7_9ACTN|nr:acyltransferase [Actinomadura macrotermitis]MQY08265.1 hypothetical protein [Actinomadura macrotermitis]